jgi:hypothetical protein
MEYEGATAHIIATWKTVSGRFSEFTEFTSLYVSWIYNTFLPLCRE